MWNEEYTQMFSETLVCSYGPNLPITIQTLTFHLEKQTPTRTAFN